MAIVISGTTGIDMGNNPVSNASQIEGTVINENGENVATTSNLTGFKNYIIDGNFDIWQRGTSQTASGYGSDDRWINRDIGSTKVHSQVACTDVERALFNANYFSRTVVSSVSGISNLCVKQQYIEDITKLAGKTVTLSFWAKADSTKNIAIEFSQVFGIGGTPSAFLSGIGVTTLTLTSTWQKFTKTVTLPSIVGKTLGTGGVHTTSTGLYFWFDAGSDSNTRTNSLGQQSGTFDIAQVQLEEGSVATPFENRPYGLELSLCQRYYEIGQAKCFINVASTGITLGTNFKVTKRVPPSMVTTGGDFLPSVYEETSNEFFRAHRSSGNIIAFHWTASAEL